MTQKVQQQQLFPEIVTRLLEIIHRNAVSRTLFFSHHRAGGRQASSAQLTPLAKLSRVQLGRKTTFFNGKKKDREIERTATGGHILCWKC